MVLLPGFLLQLDTELRPERFLRPWFHLVLFFHLYGEILHLSVK